MISDQDLAPPLFTFTSFPLYFPFLFFLISLRPAFPHPASFYPSAAPYLPHLGLASLARSGENKRAITYTLHILHTQNSLHILGTFHDVLYVFISSLFSAPASPIFILSVPFLHPHSLAGNCHERGERKRLLGVGPINDNM